MIHRITPVNDVGSQCGRFLPRDITLRREGGQRLHLDGSDFGE